MTAVAFNPKTLAPAWHAFQSALPVRLAAIHSQADLASELGTQSVVSEILNGRRQINARQAKALAQRFRVLVAVFI